MSKQKPKGTNPRKDHPLAVRLSDEMEAALLAFIGAQRVAPDKSEVTKTALREFLEREGFWPWPKPPEKT